MSGAAIVHFPTVGRSVLSARRNGMRDSHGAARRWRALWGFNGRGGLVIFAGGEVQAWVYELGHADRWSPGSMAFNESGASWVALGSNGAGGAVMWLANDLIAPLR